MSDAVHIWVRQTVDWDDEAAFHAQIPEGMRLEAMARLMDELEVR